MRVFISHSAKDADAANRIRTLLANEGFKVWDPERQLLPGSNWLSESGRALAKSDAVVFLWSGDPLHEQFARWELQYVISRPKYEDLVVPVRLASGKIPWIMENLTVIDATHKNAERTAHEIALRLKSAKPKTKKPIAKFKLRGGKAIGTMATKGQKSDTHDVVTRARR